MTLVALQAAAVLTVMETLWLVGNKPWLEEHIGTSIVLSARASTATYQALLRCAYALPCANNPPDFASVHMSVMQTRGATWWRRMQSHVAFYSATQ